LDSDPRHHKDHVDAGAPDEHPFVVPCRMVTPGQVGHWLRRGWRDFVRAPALSLLFGGVIALISVAISALAWSLGRFALLAALLSGFVFIAPLLGVGLYCVSRALEAGVFALGQLVILLRGSSCRLEDRDCLSCCASGAASLRRPPILLRSSAHSVLIRPAGLHA